MGALRRSRRARSRPTTARRRRPRARPARPGCRRRRCTAQVALRGAVVDQRAASVRELDVGCVARRAARVVLPFFGQRQHRGELPGASGRCARRRRSTTTGAETMRRASAPRSAGRRRSRVGGSIAAPAARPAGARSPRARRTIDPRGGLPVEHVTDCPGRPRCRRPLRTSRASRCAERDPVRDLGELVLERRVVDARRPGPVAARRTAAPAAGSRGAARSRRPAARPTRRRRASRRSRPARAA